MSSAVIGSPTSSKMTVEMFFFLVLPEWICFRISQFIRTISLYIVCKFQANPFRQSFKKNHISMVILFDVGGPITADDAVSSWWVPSLIFKFWIACIRIYVLPTLNLMLGLNSAANYTPRIIFSSHNMNDFTMYTYNKKAP